MTIIDFPGSFGVVKCGLDDQRDGRSALKVNIEQSLQKYFFHIFRHHVTPTTAGYEQVQAAEDKVRHIQRSSRSGVCDGFVQVAAGGGAVENRSSSARH